MALGSTQNYVVQPGDVLRFRQWSNNALGGLMLWFANSSGAYISNGLTDTDGQGIDLDSQQGQWHYRTVALTGQSPETVGSAIIDAFAINELPAPDGAFDIWLADISILSLDGTVHPIYHDQPGINFNPTPWYAQTTANLRGISEPVPASMATTQNETTYYLDDHLGTAQMEVTGTGWPVWQGQFTPFGSELDTETTSNHYKFTGKERDAESGLDYFGARYNSSSMGRFMSPDPLGGDLTNPQSLNKYAYVLNNPLTNTDPTGLYTCTDSKDCSSKKDQALEKTLAGLRNSKDADVARAANAYGAQNKDNGVSVGFADLSKSGKGGDTVSTIGVAADGSLRANSAITLNSKDGGTDFTADVGHEGSHAADAQDVVRSGLTEDGQAIHAGMNITPYQSEQRAYGVTNSILNSANESRNYVCGSGGCLLGRGATDIPGTVDRLVGSNPIYNQGGRPMSSTNQGPSVVNGVTPKATVPSVPH